MEAKSQEIPEALKMFMTHFSSQKPGVQGDKEAKMQTRTQILKMDFKMIQKYPIVGMFVMPANPNLISSQPPLESSLARWHVAYFVKQGLYQGAVLKFQIDFPLKYPLARPVAHFLSSDHIYHPLVHPKTREINLDFDFPQWQPGQHWAV